MAKPLSAAERQRLRRARIRNDRQHLQTDAGFDELNEMIAIGLLSEEEPANRAWVDRLKGLTGRK